MVLGRLTVGNSDCSVSMKVVALAPDIKVKRQAWSCMMAMTRALEDKDSWIARTY